MKKLLPTPQNHPKKISTTTDPIWNLRNIPLKNRILVHSSMLPEDLVGTVQVDSISQKRVKLPTEKIEAFIARIQSAPPLHISGLETNPDLHKFFSTLEDPTPYLIIFGKRFEVQTPTVRLYCRANKSPASSKHPPTEAMLTEALTQNNLNLSEELNRLLIQALEKNQDLIPISFSTIKTVVRQIKVEMDFDRALSPQAYHLAKALSSLYPKRIRHNPTTYTERKQAIWTSLYPHKATPPDSHPYLSDMLLMAPHLCEMPPKEVGYHEQIQQALSQNPTALLDTELSEQLFSLSTPQITDWLNSIKGYIKNPGKYITLGLEAKENRKLLRNRLKLTRHTLATTLGPTGIGKTHMAYKIHKTKPTYFCVGPCSGYGQLIATQEIDQRNDRVKLTTGVLLEYIQACQAANSAEEEPPVMIIDEATLLPEWSVLTALIEGGGLWMNGDFHKLETPRIYVLGNEGYSGRKALSDLEIYPIQRWLTYSRDFIFHRMIKPAAGTEKMPSQLLDTMAQSLIESCDIIHRTVSYESFGPREIQDISAEVSLLPLTQPTDIQAQVIFLCLKSLSSIMTPSSFKRISQNLLGPSCPPDVKDKVKTLIQSMPTDVKGLEGERLSLLTKQTNNPYLKKGLLVQDPPTSLADQANSCAQTGFYDSLEQRIKDAEASGPLILHDCHLLESHLWEGKVNGPLSNPNYTGIISFHCKHTQWSSPALNSRCTVITQGGIQLLKGIVEQSSPTQPNHSPNHPHTFRTSGQAPYPHSDTMKARASVRLVQAHKQRTLLSTVRSAITKAHRYLHKRAPGPRTIATHTDAITYPRGIQNQRQLFFTLTEMMFPEKLTILDVSNKPGSTDFENCRPITKQDARTANFEYAPPSDVPLEINNWYTLPSLSPTQVFTDFPDNTTVIQDPRTGLFYFKINSHSPPIPTFKIDYTPLKSTLECPSNTQLLTNKYKPVIQESLREPVQQVLAKLGIGNNTPPIESVKKIECYLRSFSATPLDGIQPDATQTDIIKAIFDQRKGVCRHRMDCAEQLLSYLNISYVRVTNDSHTYLLLQTSTGDWICLDPTDTKAQLHGKILEEDPTKPITPNLTHPDFLDEYGLPATLVYSSIEQQTGKRGQFNAAFLDGSAQSPLLHTDILFKRKRIVFSNVPNREIFTWFEKHGFAISVQATPPKPSKEVLYIKLRESQKQDSTIDSLDHEALVKRISHPNTLYRLAKDLESIGLYPLAIQKEIFNKLSPWMIATLKSETSKNTKRCLCAFLAAPSMTTLFFENTSNKKILLEDPELLLEFLSIKDKDGDCLLFTAPIFRNLSDVMTAFLNTPQHLYRLLLFQDKNTSFAYYAIDFGYVNEIIEALKPHPKLFYELLLTGTTQREPLAFHFRFRLQFKRVIDILKHTPQLLLNLLQTQHPTKGLLLKSCIEDGHFPAIHKVYSSHPESLARLQSIKSRCQAPGLTEGARVARKK